ncbi:MAG: hypothetical protein K0R22_1706 [Sporomusa sp.]|jgi:hypothetical protein|nr:hypothetical protein [Sporomusa sp.]MDF2875023.1 hypothetical protein [Sporomusa sp.]
MLKLCFSTASYFALAFGNHKQITPRKIITMGNAVKFHSNVTLPMPLRVNQRMPKMPLIVNQKHF